MVRRIGALLGLALVIVLSLAPAVGAAGVRATGTFVNGAGVAIGRVTLEQLADNSVKVAVTLNDATTVKPGMHGIHFHAVGKCDGTDFTTAGAHFNPTSKQHGLKNPQGAHSGDLPNLPIDATTAAQGGYAASLTTTSITLAAGATSVFDADGTALVIHADPDDEMTDPSGNSGARVACAVLQQTAAPGLPNTGGGAAATQRSVLRQAALLGLLVLSATVALTGIFRRRRA